MGRKIKYSKDFKMNIVNRYLKRERDCYILINIAQNNCTLFVHFTIDFITYDKVEKNQNKESVRKTYEIDFLATKGTRMYYI